MIDLNPLQPPPKFGTHLSCVSPPINHTNFGTNPTLMVGIWISLKHSKVKTLHLLIGWFPFFMNFYREMSFQNFELSTIVMLPSGPHKLELRSTNGPAVPENDLENRYCARSTHKKEEEEERRINEQLF